MYYIYISDSDINALIGVLNIELEALLNVQMLISSLSMLTKTLYMLFHRKGIKIGNIKLTIVYSTLQQTSLCNCVK